MPDKKPKPKPKPGPEAERLKLEGDWEDAAKRMLDKERPPKGSPDGEGEPDQDDNTPAD